MFRLMSVVVALTLSALSGLPALADGIGVHDAYAVTSRPGAPTGAAFMVIHNHGGPDDRLIGVQSSIAARTELHSHLEADGMMQMVELTDGLPLPKDGRIVLASGGDHVMFIGLTDALTDGQVIELTLIFAVAGEVTISVPVDLARLGRAAEPDAMTDHDHGDAGSGG